MGNDLATLTVDAVGDLTDSGDVVTGTGNSLVSLMKVLSLIMGTMISVVLLLPTVLI